MPTKIRLARGGSKKRPFYRIVVADQRMPRDGRFIEKIGTFDPLLARDDEKRLVVDNERVKYWLGTGAQLTDRIQKILSDAKVVTLSEKQAEKLKSRIKAVQDKIAKIKAKEEAEKAAEETKEATA